MPRLNHVTIKGFRSIRDAELELRPMNVLIGANGSGKSNLVAFFKMLNEMIAGRLQHFINKTGGASSNLYFGPKVTPELWAHLSFDEPDSRYEMRMSHAAGDVLVFDEEVLHDVDSPRGFQLVLEPRETGLNSEKTRGRGTVVKLKHLIRRCRAFHFHDTSPTARVRQHCYVEDNRWLLSDAGNLAAVLYRLKRDHRNVYERIVATVRQVAPFFVDFDLEPTGVNGRDILLNWRHQDSDLLFGPHQLSDGTLRAICLISLLMQPEEDLPYLIIVDEPELGLHPYALNIVASLFQSASQRTQVLVSTQSPTFLDRFAPEDVIIAERKDEATVFTRPDADKLAEWLEDYSLGEVWEKNIFGGGPH